MQKNIKWFDRLLRFIGGVILLAWAIAGGPWWTFIGLFPLATAAWGFCPIYFMLKINET